MTSDHYRTPASPADAEIRIDRSRFLGFVFPVSTEAEFASELEILSKRFHDATHLCWAWRLAGDGTPRERSSDAGEPHGTAGKPILSAIEGAALFDVAVVVVRFYGGIKLGTGGLSRAYRAAAQAAIAATSVFRIQKANRQTRRAPFLHSEFSILNSSAHYSSTTFVPAILSPVRRRPEITR